MNHRLVRDPAPPAATISDFFAERRRLYEIDPAQFASWEPAGGDPTARWFVDLPRLWDAYELIEFWADSDPNSQLILIQFLDWINQQDLPISKLKLMHVVGRLGDREANDPRSLNATLVQAQVGDLHSAHLAWAAFRRPTPEDWAALLHSDLHTLPFLRSLVLRMLQELPSEDTALGASEQTVLALAADGSLEIADVLRKFGIDQEAPMLTYWEVGKLIDFFAEAPNPTIVGMERGPFDMALHEDKARYNRYMRGRLSLSPFGRALFERREDFTSRRRLHRWWGGTQLTNQSCWRWRNADHTLMRPA